VSSVVPPCFLRCSVWSPSLFVISDGAHPNLEVKALPESHDARNVKAVTVRSTGVMSGWMDGGSCKGQACSTEVVGFN